MNIDKYKIYLLISQNKKVSEIAKMLGVSQPTISFHLKSLEESMGIKLFDSDKKNLTLTDTGRHLLPYAKEIVELEENMIKRVVQYRDFNYGEIHIGSTLSPGMHLLPNVVKNFNTVYKNIHLSIDINAAHEIIQDTLTKKYDLGLVATRSEIPETLVSETISEDRLVLVFHKKLLSEFQNNDFLKMLTQFNLIQHCHGSSTRKLVDNFLIENKIELNSTITVNSIEIIKAMVKNNIGISFLPYALVADDLKENRIATIDLNVLLPTKLIKLIYPANRYIAPHILKFIDFIRIDPNTF